MKQWCQSSEQDFWREFSDASGQKFSYTSIVDRLTQIWKEQDRKMAVVEEYIMVRNSRIYFSTKKAVCSLSKPRIAILQSSSNRSWQSRACLLEKSITLLVLTWTWTLIDSEWRCLDFLPVFFIFFILFFLYHALGYYSSIVSTLRTLYFLYLGTLIYFSLTTKYLK